MYKYGIKALTKKNGTKYIPKTSHIFVNQLIDRLDTSIIHAMKKITRKANIILTAWIINAIRYSTASCVKLIPERKDHEAINEKRIQLTLGRLHLV